MQIIEKSITEITPSEILQNVEKQLQEQNVLLKKILERLRE